MGQLTIEQLKKDCNRLNKDQLVSFFQIEKSKKVKKPELIDRIVTELTRNELALRRFYKEFVSLLAMSPYELEQTLDCTGRERKLWAEEDRLPVFEYRTLSKWSRIIRYPVFDRYRVYQIKPEMIAKWRLEHKEEKEVNKKKAIQKRVKTKHVNEMIKEDFRGKWKRLLVKWSSIDMSLGATFQLAYWTVWLVRWAEVNRVKMHRAIKKYQIYKTRMEENYHYKNIATRLLVLSPFSKVVFYRPEYHKKESIFFCNKHYELWCDLRGIEYMDKWEFFEIFRKEILKCPLCRYKVEDDYYSLFYLTVKDERVPDYVFSFHTPYPLGKAFFPPIKTLPVTKYEEDEGMFMSGLRLFQEEKIVYREHEVEKYFQEALEKYKLYLSADI